MRYRVTVRVMPRQCIQFYIRIWQLDIPERSPVDLLFKQPTRQLDQQTCVL